MFLSFWAKIWTNDDIPGGLSETCGFSKLKIILGQTSDKWWYSGWFVRNMWFFQTQNYFEQKFGQMTISLVVCQKHVVFPNSKSFWAEIWTNGDFSGASSDEAPGKSPFVQISAQNDRNMWFFETQNYCGKNFGQMTIFGVRRQHGLGYVSFSVVGRNVVSRVGEVLNFDQT